MSAGREGEAERSDTGDRTDATAGNATARSATDDTDATSGAASSPSSNGNRADGARPGALTAAFDYEAVSMDDSPARLSALVAIGAALVAAAASAATLATLGVSLLGAAILVTGILVGSRRILGIGTAGLLGSVALAGITGSPPGPLLIASAATAVAWDVGENAITLGEHLGRAADTRRAEVVHAAGTIGVTGSAAAIGIVAYRLSGPRPSLALVTLLLGAVLLVIALGD